MDKDVLLFAKVLGCVVIFMGGFAYGSLAHYVDNISDCTGFTKKGVEWKGYRAIGEKSNDRRCFFVEQRFPYRVKHGVEKI